MISEYITLYHIICHIILYYIIVRHIILYHVMLYCSKLYYADLRTGVVEAAAKCQGLLGGSELINH